MGQSQRQESDVASGAEDNRRSARRLEAHRLGPVVARLVGGSEVRLIDFSRRGVLVESETRLLIGARASVKITTTDAVVTVSGYVVRSRVAGVRDSVLVYHTAMALNDDLGILEEAAQARERVSSPEPESDQAIPERADAAADGSEPALQGPNVTGSDESAADPVLEFLATVPHDLAELRRRAAVNNW